MRWSEAGVPPRDPVASLRRAAWGWLSNEVALAPLALAEAGLDLRPTVPAGPGIRGSAGHRRSRTEIAGRARLTDACLDPSSARCALGLADWLEAERWSEEDTTDPVEAPPAPHTPLTAWWAVSGMGPVQTREADAWVTAHVRWLRSLPPHGRGRALLDLLSSQQGREPGEAGPLGVLRDPDSPPWSAAMTALVLGSNAGIEIDVRHGDGRLVIDVEGVGLSWDGCGPVPPDDKARSAIDEQVVWVSMVLEAAAQLEEPRLRRRLEGFAARLGGPRTEATDAASELGTRLALRGPKLAMPPALSVARCEAPG